jgi:peptidoglycan/xylan/chitin deacetylase (PgdA/CDA1 family)
MKFLLILGFVFSLCLSYSDDDRTIKVALSFDDAPMPTSVYMTGDERTERLLKTLEKHNIKTVFFVNSAKFEGFNGLNRIKRYDSAGHFIANHTSHHSMLSKVSAEKYINEIIECDSKIKDFQNYRRWFRYPYLDQSNDIPKRDSVWQYLDDNNYKIGYCTVDNYEWYVNSQFQKNKDKGINPEKFEDYYFRHILESIKFYDDISKKQLAHNSSHILLLHENDINAIFLDELLEFLKEHNIEIISPEIAYKDNILSFRPDVTQNYQGRVASVAYSKGYKGMLSQKSEDTDYLDSLFNAKQIINFSNK